ncbi:hypothetical protein [Mesorhizobium sp. WSM3860]|uniref:hypothetical protein n=1 Tax=Mesorhizobium sp. WSM3860 TaxID=2029403 RepID=UPI000BAEF59F|nr:hypothetical protein [Mesorhizobium sp. WSM3860]PBC03776.1 hypothetical protein CK220_14620 [Mesorhizobium sp. WSM3860]
MSAGADLLALYGTDEPLPQRRVLAAGPLTAVLEDGNLRTISFAGVEVVRAINYLARDASWGTYKAELSNMRISEDGTSFELRYDGLCAGPQGRFAYRMKIRGDASGELILQADGVALTEFPTNRTGFVVLHPSEAAGKRLTIRHSDGSIEERTFPKLISPDQPALDISALTHEPAPGMVCTVAMQGDAFEMEDQRNWTDASFKTYVRPLSKPRPYVIGKGVGDIQRVTVSVRAETSAPGPAVSNTSTLTLGGPSGRMPSIALFVDPDELPAAIAGAASLGPVPEILLRFDNARGHDQRVLEKAADLASALGARLAVEAIFAAIHPGAEAQALAAMVRLAAVEPSAILVSPRREFKTRPSNHLPNSERPIDEIVQALRAVGPACPIGAGTPSLFTEFNRNPPTGNADFVFFGNSAIVHAADEQSVMETLTVYPAVMETARQLCPGKPIWLGPCTIGLRHNPYGEAVAANPGLNRVPAAGTDPRQRALFGAAFAVGVAAQAAETAAERLILAAPTGPFGLLNEDGSQRPLQAVHAELAAAAGAERHHLAVDHSGVAAVAFRLGDTVRVLAANLTARPIETTLPPGAKLLRMAGGNTKPAQSLSRSLGPYCFEIFEIVTKEMGWRANC